MDAIQESINQMMEKFNKRLDTIEGQLPRNVPASPGSLEAEFVSFKAFALQSMRTLQNQIALLAQQIELMEVRGRRKILLLHGVPEVQKEDTAVVAAKTVSERLKLTGFDVSGISRCHRMGRAAGNKPRPILIKFRDSAVRDKVWTTKTSLKGSGLTLSEFLIKTRHAVFMAARDRLGVTKCWTSQGNVLALMPDGSRIRLNSLSDLEAITPKLPQKTPDVSKDAVSAVPVKSRRAAASKKQ